MSFIGKNKKANSPSSQENFQDLMPACNFGHIKVLIDPLNSRYIKWCTFSSVQFSHSVMSDSLRPHESQHARPPCPSPTPGLYSNSCPSSRWCHPSISSSVIPFSSCPQSFPASGSFPMSQFFASDGQNTRASALPSVFPMNIQDWFPWGLTDLISVKFKDSQVFSITTVQKHQFFDAELSLWSNFHIHTWLLERP